MQYNQKPSIHQLVLASLCSAVLLLLSQNICSAAEPIFDISGAWDSKFGVIDLEMKGLEKKGVAIVTGTYTSGANKAQIVWGRLYKSKGINVLKMEYYMHWKPLYGYAEFRLDPIRGQLNGKYFQAFQNGPWNMTRRKGPNLEMVSNLNLVRNPSSKRGSKTFSVTGDWDSNFGKVKLVGTSLAAVKQVKGEFKRADGKVGKITSGAFTKTFRGGKLWFDYYCPWNKVRGKATFRPDDNVGGKMLIGVYDQGKQKGAWTMCRPYKAN